jgi:hypothetical protein
MKFVSLDPGGTTGVLEVVLSDDLTRIESWNAFQIDADPHHVPLWTYLHGAKPKRIICEQFEYRQFNQGKYGAGARPILISRNYIGVVELFSQLTETELIMQPPSTIALKWLTDEMLKRLNKHHAGQPHANDATRHMLYYLVQTLEMRFLLDPLKPR